MNLQYSSKKGKNDSEDSLEVIRAAIPITYPGEAFLLSYRRKGPDRTI